jgi:hypothetical protein
MRFKSIFWDMLGNESEGGDIRSNRLYTLVKDNVSGGTVVVEPTPYFQGLDPSEAITEVKTYVEQLFEKLRRYSEMNQKDLRDLEEAHHLLYELEIAQQFLIHIRQGFAKKGYSVK